MTSRDTWFKCDPTAFLGGIEALSSPAEIACYVVAVLRIYEAGGRIANNPKVIAALAQMPTQHATRAINSLIERGKLIERGGYLTNPRAEREIDARKELSATRSEVGKTGGRPRSNSGPTDGGPTSNRRRTDLGLASNSVLSETNSAENSQSEKAIAYPRAREEREEKEKTSPTPPHRPVPIGLDRMPDFPDRIDPDTRRQLIERLDVVDRGEPIDPDVTAKLTGEIMREARMTVPPSDLVLVGSWVRLGMDAGEIMQIVTRMAAGARGGVRGMRYFDAEIRRVHEAKASAEDSNIAYFNRITQRYAG